MIVNKKNIVSFITLLFFISVPIGIYLNVEQGVIYAFLTCSIVVLALNVRNIKLSFDYKKSSILILWFSYILISILSTIFFSRYTVKDISGIIVEILFTVILFILTRFWNAKYFLIIFRNFIILLAIITIFGEIFRFDPFELLKKGTQFTSIDANGAVSTIFEFRHYYGAFLIAALIIIWEFPFKNGCKNFIYNLILLINLILTNTRNAWVAFIIVFILWILKENKFRISKHSTYKIMLIVLILIAFFLLFSNILEHLINVIDFRIMDLVTSQNKYGGATGVRGYTIENGTKYIIENWQKYLLIGGGNGFALDWFSHNPYGLVVPWSAAIDVQYVTTFMNTGILGLMCIFFILFINFKNFVNSSTRIGKSFSLMLIALSIMMAFFDVIPFDNSPFVFWIICICGMNTISFKEKNEKN